MSDQLETFSDPKGSLGTAIKRARLAKGMTLESLGDAVGVSLAFLSRIERGERQPSEDLASRLERALEVPAGEFTGRLGVWVRISFRTDPSTSEKINSLGKIATEAAASLVIDMASGSGTAKLAD
jgi:transcriptional regulator with XRE-family HTH domain